MPRLLGATPVDAFGPYDRLIRGCVLICILAAVLSGCSGEESASEKSDNPSGRSAADPYQDAFEQDVKPGPSLEPAESAEEALERDRARARRRLGDRPDFKIPQRAIAGKGDYDAWYTAIERIFLEFDTPYEPDPRLARLTRGQRALYVLYWADSEILNGGFSQFYFNSTGYFAPDLPDAATYIGAAAHARLAGSANAILAGRGGEVPRARAARQRLLDRVPLRKLAPLENRWFDLDDQGVLARRAAQYARSHRPEFFTP